MTHPLDTIIQTGVAVSKGDFKDYARKTFLADNAAQVPSTNLIGTLFILCPVETGLGLFVYDPSDTISAQDVPAGILRSSDDRVYKRQVLGASDIQSFVLEAIAAAGGVDAGQLAGGAADTLLGRDGAGDGANLSLADVVGLFDTFIGTSDWRATNTDLDVSKIDRLPENVWSGGFGTLYVLMKDGRVRAAGSGLNLANGNEQAANLNILSAVGVVGGSPVFKKIWSGGSQCYALDSDGHPWAMGHNSDGQLGLGDAVNRAAFEEITYFRTNGLTVTDIRLAYAAVDNTIGALFAVFLCTNGKAYICGNNVSGQAGNGDTTQNNAPVVWGDGYTAGGVTDIDGVWVAAQADQGAVYVSRTNGDVIAAGYDFYGAMALGSAALERPTAIKLTAVTNAVQIATDAWTTLYRLADGTLLAAGRGNFGQRGDGTFNQATTPANTTETVQLGGDCLDVQLQPSAGFGTVTALVETSPGARTLKAWGRNPFGQFGVGNTTDSNVPVTPSEPWNGSVDEQFIVGSDAFISVFARVGNTLYSCGYNGRANLVRAGTGLTEQSLFGPVTGMFGTVEQIHFCGNSSLAGPVWKTDKTVLVGGENFNGKLGIGADVGLRFSSLQDLQAPNPTGPSPNPSLPSFTVASLPAASSYTTGTQVFVTDEVGGAVPAFTDGTNWLRVTDRAIVS